MSSQRQSGRATLTRSACSSPLERVEAKIAAMLSRSMFGAGDSCKAGGYFASGDIEDRLAERVALFKRLCDPALAIGKRCEFKRWRS
jgi:hypothetical protein